MTREEFLEIAGKAFDAAMEAGCSNSDVEIMFDIDSAKATTFEQQDGSALPQGCKFCCKGGRCGVCCTFPL
ncbi:hypothetical protein [Loktanella sp. 3ANDIMAR09]|uniref:hypothetical protein n=1 Tax=Loktanella sp. 3ANDIMAR09 TaxID=1225657 RepID=UPI0012EDA3A1|nr:hypothetical protein [Loktanella sp. 3ANDIMAR09]